MNRPIIILSTASTLSEAESISRTLVEEKLAACVNRIPEMRSCYVWNGAFHDEGEILLIIKTDAVHLEKIIDRIKSLHSYEVPEIIALPIVGGSKDYLHWIEKMLMVENGF